MDLKQLIPNSWSRVSSVLLFVLSVFGWMRRIIKSFRVLWHEQEMSKSFKLVSILAQLFMGGEGGWLTEEGNRNCLKNRKIG